MAGAIEEVCVDRAASSRDVEAVREAFARYGLHVEVATVETRSGDLLPWFVGVTVTTPIVAFFASFGSEAGKDAYPLVKQWIRDVFATGAGRVTVEDSEGSSLSLPSRIPDEALDALSTINWEHKRGQYLTWDE
jgi:hypothetical protein